MPKRFSDTEIWKKDWFLELTDKQKLLVKFLFDNCDCAGIYEISKRILKMSFEESITKEDFKALKQIRFINDNTIFIEDFIKFQYNVEISSLNPKYNVHKGIIAKLNKYNILSTLSQPLTNPYSRVLDKDMVKDKDNILFTNNINEEKFFKNSNPDFYFLDDKNKIFEIYEKECPNLISLTWEKRSRKILDKANSFLSEISSDWDYFKNLCQKANKLKKIANTKIDFEMLINCHIGIMNGKYEKDGNKKGVSQEFINDFFANLKDEEKK